MPMIADIVTRNERGFVVMAEKLGFDALVFLGKPPETEFRIIPATKLVAGFICMS